MHSLHRTKDRYILSPLSFVNIGRNLIRLLVDPPVSGYPSPVLFIKSKIVILFSPFFSVDRIGFL